MKNNIVKNSKFLSLILRHRPETVGVALDAQGWIKVDELLSAIQAYGKKIDRDMLEEIVASNDKQRFAFSKDGLLIRANQGHSLDLDIVYEEQHPPAVLYHGTASRFLDSIYQNGLQKQNRHHVHLSAQRDTAIQVGSRYGKVVLLMIDAKKMSEDGIRFYRSENDVWLCDAVPPAYLSEEPGDR